MKNMAVVSIIKLSELGGAKRIDAELYSPDIVTYKKSLQNYPKLRNLIEKVFHPKEIQRIYSETGVQFVLAQNVKDILMTFEESAYISQDRASLIQDNLLRNGDCLIVRSGANYGDAAVYTAIDPKPAYASADVIVVRPRDVSGEFLAVFFNTKVGGALLKNLGYGAGQPHIRPQEIKHLPIFKPQQKFTEEVVNNVNVASKCYKEAERLYSQVEHLLLEELGLKDFKPKYELSYSANLSKAFGVHRVDAEYFQPAYDEVIKKILDYQNGYTQLLSYVENIKPVFDPTKNPDRTFFYVELADIDTSIGIIHSASKIKGEEAPSRARRILRKNDVIVSSVEGSLEKVALVGQKFEGALASTGFFQFRPIRIFPEVLLVLSKSIVLQAQLKKECAGTILTAVPNESLRRVLIPILPNEVQQKIAPLIQQSHEARRKAERLLEEAKRKVEEAFKNESQ